ncbi:MAG: serine hydrolase domain-containing protein [Candidatus Latescibacteria bacterium]|jgi:CubicO group peptidase (beta-lactamase class C family)|nr:serine hydrolase domain-containing protein [Candidatus Latescibacterota bacterium]
MSNQPFQNVEQLIKTRLSETRVSSLAVAVAQDGEIIWEEGFGMADRETQRSSTPDTIYSLASISKPITATGLMILVERGLIDLDAPANNYLGNTKLTAHIGNANDATVRRLANHTSGLPLHCHFFYADEDAVRPSFDETIHRYGHLATLPGEVYQYANSGFGFLEYIIERVSGKSYPDFLRDEVFTPLKMPNASVDLPPDKEAQSAIRYSPSGKPLPWYTFDHPGASAIWSSAHDLVRFGMFHLKNHLPDQQAILSNEIIDTMQHPTTEPGATTGYGIGWRKAQYPSGHITVNHDGSMGGVRTRLLFVPDHNIALTVLTNGGGHNLPTEICNAILETLLPDFSATTEPSEPSPSNDLPTGHWTGHVHTYAGDHTLTLDIQNETITVQVGDQQTVSVENPSFKNDHLTGAFNADIGTDDAAKHPYRLELYLKHRSETQMNGTIRVITSPEDRSGNALSYWAEARKNAD